MTSFCEKSFSVENAYRNFYAGGDLAWSTDGKIIYCLNTSEVSAVEVATGQVVQTYGTNVTSNNEKHLDEAAENEDVIYAFALAPNNEYLATAHISGLIRLWVLATGKVLKLWKGQHKGPILKLQFSPCNKLLCSSGADSTLRIWDYAQNRCVCVFKDFAGPAVLISFHVCSKKTEIFAGGADNTIYCWDYTSKELKYVLRGHLSQITGLSFENCTEQCKYMSSVSRDKVLIVWDLVQGAQHKILPLYEELVGICYIQDAKASNIVVACAQGHLRSVCCKTWKITLLIDNIGYDVKMLLQCEQSQQLAAVTAEHNVLIYDIKAINKLECCKELVGFNDEILDLCFLGPNDQYLVVATNSKNIKLYNTTAQMNCKIIAGHTDTVMTMSACGAATNLLLTAGKDFSILLWQLDLEHGNLNCLAKNCSSHTCTIGSISFAINLDNIFASVGHDGSLKVWRLKRDKDSKEYSFQIKYSAVAHDKEINSVTYSPNNKMIATASQDKTAKIWGSETNACIGTLRGHTRSIWCVRFSTIDQVVLTSSADCSLRIWSLATLGCLKRFEQDCSILRAEFIDHDKFIISAGADGLIKIWNIKTNACVQTLDEHTDRVWSLAVSKRSKKFFYSGGADSKLIRWHDVTEQCRDTEIDKRQEMLQQEQTLQNLLQQQKHLHKAFLLALNLGKPKVSYDIISNLVRQRKSGAIQQIVKQLNTEQCNTLLEHVKAWSTNSRHCKASNLVLHYILNEILANAATVRSHNISHLVEVLTPYVQRHFKRVTELNRELTFLEFVVKSI